MATQWQWQLEKLQDIRTKKSISHEKYPALNDLTATERTCNVAEALCSITQIQSTPEPTPYINLPSNG